MPLSTAPVLKLFRKSELRPNDPNKQHSGLNHIKNIQLMLVSGHQGLEFKAISMKVFSTSHSMISKVC